MTENTEDGEQEYSQPDTLREGEQPDISGHARRNIEQIRQAEREGTLDEQEADEAAQRIREGSQEVEDDAGT